MIAADCQDSFDEHLRQARTLVAGSRYNDAELEYTHALELRPDSTEARCGLGECLLAVRRWTEARDAFQRCLAQDSKQVRAWAGIATALHRERHFALALKAYRTALKLGGNEVTLRQSVGGCLIGLRLWGEAEFELRRALALRPDSATAWAMLGGVAMHQGELSEAERILRHAITLDGNLADAHGNLAATLLSRGHLDSALVEAHVTLALNPEHTVARLNQGFIHLLRENFAEGWPAYEARLRLRGPGEIGRFARQTRWTNGLPLNGKTVLVHAEQGLGDTIQFIRYIPLLAARGARVIAEVQPALKSLLGQTPGASVVLGQGEPLPEFDYYCPLLSLPHELFSNVKVPPPPLPVYIPPETAAAWKHRLSRPKPRVGVIWSGNPGHDNDRNRSIPFSIFRTLWERWPDIAFLSLQKNPSPADADALRSLPNVLNIGPEFHDFTDTAAAIQQLDAVVAVDTSVAHLAGTLGRPLWLLVPAVPDWRWLLGRTDSPWYPSAKLFRQPKSGDWNSALDAIHAELARSFD